MMHQKLFEGQNLWLSAIDAEQDAKVETEWTVDLDYAQELMDMPARPLGALELKKIHEDELKNLEDRGNQFYFAIRLKDGDKLAGFVRFPYIFWTHSAAGLRLAIADPVILERFGAEALRMALVYAFNELNLYRIETTIPAYRTDLIDLYERAGFLLEVRRRQVFYRNGRYHDALLFGLLHEEWQATQLEEAVA